ncbi:MAG: hypothetical protein NC548_57505 [Lachnospiraceae bacterium]|nr:hypothetical protein [Lachnospiraceae bacterium]
MKERISITERLRNLNMTQKALHAEICKRGRKISLASVNKMFNDYTAVLPRTRQIVEDTLTELEKEVEDRER